MKKELAKLITDYLLFIKKHNEKVLSRKSHEPSEFLIGQADWEGFAKWLAGGYDG